MKAVAKETDGPYDFAHMSRKELVHCASAWGEGLHELGNKIMEQTHKIKKLEHRLAMLQGFRSVIHA